MLLSRLSHNREPVSTPRFSIRVLVYATERRGSQSMGNPSLPRPQTRGGRRALWRAGADCKGGRRLDGARCAAERGHEHDQGRRGDGRPRLAAGAGRARPRVRESRPDRHGSRYACACTGYGTPFQNDMSKNGVFHMRHTHTSACSCSFLGPTSVAAKTNARAPPHTGDGARPRILSSHGVRGPHKLWLDSRAPPFRG